MRTIAKTFGTAMTLAALALWAPQASALSSYYTGGVGANQACTNCHLATPNTCNGCHAHGTHANSGKTSINVTATTNKASYTPGETVTVTVSGGYRTGWVRVNLYDQNMVQLARSSCPGGTGNCTTSVLPATLTATAPTTPGTYTWRASWYGNAYDTGFTSPACTGTGSALTPPCFRQDPGNNNAGAIHGEEIIALASFTVTAPAAPVIALNPASLSFGNVNVATPASLTTQVQNTGTATLNVTGIARCTAPATSAEFTFSPATLTVAAGQSATLTATYTPTAAGTDTGCIALTSNASNGPTTNLAVSGTGVVPPAPSISVSPTSLAFGTVAVGTPSSKTFTISNTGNATLTGTIARAGGTSAEYAFSPASFSVAGGGNQVVTVTYTPVDTTTDSGSLVVSSNDAANPTVSVALSGTGAATPVPTIALSPASLGFGTVTVGGAASLTTQVQNTGTATLNVTGIALCTSPSTSTEFTFSPATLTVTAGQSATLTATYTPTAAGTDTGCIALTSNASNGPTTNLTVSGTGVAAPAPSISVSPTSLAFGSVAVNTPSSKTFTISNTGNAALTGTIARAGGTSAEYAFSPASFTVAGGGNQVVTVTYTPVDGTTDSGSLVVSSNDAANPTVSVTLSGTGVTNPVPAIALAPTSLDLGTVTVGGSTSLAAQVENAGTATLNVTGIALCNGTSGEFTWTSPSTPFAVAPGAAATVTVTYAPADTGTDSGCLAISSDDPASPTVNLGVSGTGAAPGAPAIGLTPAALDFGTVTVGSSVTKATLVGNTGNAALTVSGVARCNGTSAEFTFSPATLTVNAGQSATLNVTYTPTDTTTDTGCIALVHDATNQASPLDLAVTGTGALGSATSGCGGCGGGPGSLLGLGALLVLAALRGRRRR